LDERIQEQQFEGLVTYNGRCFDIPLLITRFISNRRRDRLARLPHLDLLYPVRQLWKLKYGDCSLANIEKQVLGVRREGDIPGEEIPGPTSSLFGEAIPGGSCRFSRIMLSIFFRWRR
jgi:uncharacterized protein YprB with RNaseH-like and TPR domain